MRRLIVLAAAVLISAVAALGWSATATAGYSIQPASGTTVDSTSPAFLVDLDANDTNARVYVASSPEMSSTTGTPVREVGSCNPSTPWTGPGQYSCQPSFYSTTSTGRLDPGTYYWWLRFYTREPGQISSTLHISGPLVFAVPEPTAPAGAALVSPADGATVSQTPLLVVQAPAQSTVEVYVSDSSERLGDGSPAGTMVDSCKFSVPSDGNYDCQIEDDSQLEAGQGYFWWAVITVDESRWIYGPRSFTVRQPPGTGGGGGGGSTAPPPREVSAAPYLPTANHFVGGSVKHGRLGKAAYRLSKMIGAPRTVAVACWSARDWQNISGDNPEDRYSTLGFVLRAMPRWIQLSPGICRSMETLLYKRPQYANVYMANAVDTLTHEMIHSLGVGNEAITECFAMQLTAFTAVALGVPSAYANRLGKLTLGLYSSHPPAYVNRSKCRENGAWDLFPREPSLPWHHFKV